MLLSCGKFPPLGAGRQGLLKDRVIVDIAKKHGKSAAQVILRWDLQRGIITIPRSKNPAHLKENISVMDFQLSDEEMRQIDALNCDDALWEI